MTDLEDQIDRRLQQLLTQYPPAQTDAATFLGAQFDLGLAWVAFPEGWGGLGASPGLQSRIEQTLHAAGAPKSFEINVVGYGMAAPTVLAYASAADCERLLRPMFVGDEIWAQLFSEPGAGSDVAGLATRAVRDGDDWIVNGQKVWTTMAHRAKWGLLVARTDPALPKHAGLTYFIVDMHAPGVDVRPLRQATGNAEFNEVYLSDVRVPDSARLGAVGEGWKVALTTLANERASIGGRVDGWSSLAIAAAVKLWKDQGQPTDYYDRLMRLWVREQTLRLTNMRSREDVSTGGSVGPEGSINKLLDAELNQDVYDFCLEVLGAEALLYPPTYALDAPFLDERVHDLRYEYLRALANTIEGGTSEIMRNILGERVLGLGPEPRVDKGRPWNQPIS